MPTFNDPFADAAEAQPALRALAHATRSTGNPAQLRPVLGSLTVAAASLEQPLQQLAAIHKGPAQQPARVNGDNRAHQPALHPVSWELYQASEILRQVIDALEHAHGVESLIIYDHPDVPLLPEPPRTSPHRRLSL